MIRCIIEYETYFGLVNRFDAIFDTFEDAEKTMEIIIYKRSRYIAEIFVIDD